jgi:hypothetical protein
MAIENFNATVQYNDHLGTVAAYRAAQQAATEWLQERELKHEGEFLLGIEMYAGENHGVHRDPVSVHFLLVTPGDYDNVKEMLDSTEGPVEVRKVSEEMPLDEFFGLFKRFSVCLSPDGMLDDREYRYTE